jgi:hypothetical protein
MRAWHIVVPLVALLSTLGCDDGMADIAPGADGGSAAGRDAGRAGGGGGSGGGGAAVDGPDGGGARLDGGWRPDDGVDAGVPAPSGPVSLADATHVRLLPGSPFYERQELHRRGYLASLEPDRLLFEYRKLAGLPQAGGATAGYAGWDTGFIRGHMAGHYLSAASRMAAATGDAAFKKKVEYLVAELAKCQAALGQDGYLAAFSSAAFDALEGKPANAGGIVVPYYTLQKILSGLLDAHHYVGSQEALEVAKKLGEYVRARLAALPASTIEKIFRTDGSRNPQNEFGAMSDALAALSVATGEAKYLETAKIFNRSWFIDPLAAGQDNLQGLHGNTHVAQALGIAHTGNLSGESLSLKASEFFWKLLSGHRAFVIGGNSFHEWLDKAGVEAGASIDNGASLPASTAETCNSHNMLKLTALLFSRSQRLEYVDYHERTLYNHILGSVAPDTGDMTYFTPLRGHFRTYMNGTYCCTGTGIENTARYGEGIYFQQEHQAWVNLYIPSELTWDATGMTLRQEGNAAAGEAVRLTVVKAAGPVLATVKLRIPFWVSGTAVLTVNGVAEPQALIPSSYATLSRQWRAGDVVTLQLPTALRLERAKDVPSMVSVLYGPILLAGELGRDRMPSDVGDPSASLGTPAVNVPAIANGSTDPATWLRPAADAPLSFTAHDAGPANGLTFRPLYQVHHQRYSVYWTLQ